MDEWTTSDVRAAAIYGPTRDGLQYPEKEVRERLRADGFDRWLATHDAEVAAKAVEDAATEANLAWVAYRPDGWGSNDSDNGALDAFLWALKWLRARAAELTRDAPSR